jgi:outer membrane protein assembly factor BamA
MILCRVLLTGAVLCAVAPVCAQTPAATQSSPPPIVQRVELTGLNELGRRAALRAIDVREGQPLPDSPDRLAEALRGKYRDEGYLFARVEGSFDAATGTLAFAIDEGVIDEVEFRGVDERRAAALAEDFAIRAGDVFNRDKAREALDALLRPSRGALRPGHGRSDEIFDLIDDNGRRRLVVGVHDPSGAFRLAPNFGEREDWFSAVDGFAPSLGFGGAVFDHTLFNHAYIAGHLSYKFGPDRVGYALGFERPVFDEPKLFFGAELYDFTASDDRWQVSNLEASVDAIAARSSFRDYYRRRGAQLHAAVRVERHVELLFAWRGERHNALAVESDFSLFNRDDAFRPNALAAPGRLNTLVFGATAQSGGFATESLAATYRRHQLDMPFGDRLPEYGRYERESASSRAWRADWTSEIASPSALGGDFDFQRHIVSGRIRQRLSRREEIRLRAIGGWTDGAPPPQRLFGAGGMGSVHGYVFKEAIGTDLALLNAEYAIGRLAGLHLITFFDAARVTPVDEAPARWLKGVGFGIGLTRELRVDFGYKLNDIPGSLQVLVRIDRPF